MVTHSRILAWSIPWTEEPGGLQSVGSQSQTGLKQLSMHAHTAQEFFLVNLTGHKRESDLFTLPKT